jgi:hypothetical protein
LCVRRAYVIFAPVRHTTMSHRASCFDMIQRGVLFVHRPFIAEVFFFFIEAPFTTLLVGFPERCVLSINWNLIFEWPSSSTTVLTDTTFRVDLTEGLFVP